MGRSDMSPSSRRSHRHRGGDPLHSAQVELPMPGDERLNLLLSTLARVAIAVELEPTLQILLDSFHEVVPFDAGGIFLRDAKDHVVRPRVTRGYPADLKMPADEGIVGSVLQTGQPRLV